MAPVVSSSFVRRGEGVFGRSIRQVRNRLFPLAVIPDLIGDPESSLLVFVAAPSHRALPLRHSCDSRNPAMTIRLRGVCFFRRKPGKSRVYYKVTTYLRCASRLSHARYRNSRYLPTLRGVNPRHADSGTEGQIRKTEMDLLDGIVGGVLTALIVTWSAGSLNQVLAIAGADFLGHQKPS